MFSSFDLNAFLKHGFFLQLDPNRYVVAWGRFESAEQTPQDRCSLYAPDFYLNQNTDFLIPEHWCFVDQYTFVECLLKYKTAASSVATVS